MCKRIVCVGMQLLLVLATAGALAETQVEDFEDGSLDGVWDSGNPFGGAEPGSVVIAGGVLTFNKTGSSAGSTEFVGLAAGGAIDNRFPAPWTVEYTIPDVSDFGDSAGFMINRFFRIDGAVLLDWVFIARSGNDINIGVPDGSPLMYTFDATTTNSLDLKFDVAVSGLTVFAAANGGAFDSGQTKTWLNTVDTDDNINMLIGTLDLFGPTNVGPYAISIDDLTITAPTLPTGGEGEGEGEPLFPPGVVSFLQNFDAGALDACFWTVSNDIAGNLTDVQFTNGEAHFVNDSNNSGGYRTAAIAKEATNTVTPNFTLELTLPDMSDFQNQLNYLSVRFFQVGVGELPSYNVGNHFGQYNIFQFGVGTHKAFPLSTTSVEMWLDVQSTGVSLYAGADGAEPTFVSTIPRSGVAPTDNIGISIETSNQFTFGQVGFWDVSTDNLIITSADLPQCARDQLLPAANSIGLGVLPVVLLGVGIELTTGGAVAVFSRKGAH